MATSTVFYFNVPANVPGWAPDTLDSILPKCSTYVLMSRWSGTMPATAEQSPFAEATDEEIDEIIAEFGGNYRLAVRCHFGGVFVTFCGAAIN